MDDKESLTNRNATFKYLQTHISPLSDGFQINTSVNEGLSEISPSCT